MRIRARTRVARFAAGILASWSLLGCAEDPATTGSTSNAYASERTVIFFDDFRGTSIDTTKWTALDRLSDQVNHEVNCVVPRNVSVKDGVLEGISKYEDHSCGDSVDPPKT